MRIGMIGISYKSAPLELREEVARVAQERISFGNCVVLSTCNRTEIYFTAENLAEAHSDILRLFKREIALPFEHALYAFFGAECFSHLAMVTAGLESALLGESDIQRQVKTAYLRQSNLTTLSHELHFLFQKSLKIGKEVRSSFDCPMHLEGLVLQLVQNFFNRKQALTIFFIGYSETNRKIAHLFLKNRLGKITFCTASPHSAEPFALDYGISLVGRERLSSWSDFDLVISATHQHLISHLPFSFKTKLMLDLSVPRSISPELGRNSFMTLLNMEELGNLVTKERRKRYGEVSLVQKKIENTVQRQVEIFRKKQEVKWYSIF